MMIWMLRFFPQEQELYVYFNTKRAWWKSTPFDKIFAKTTKTYDFRNDPKEMERFFVRFSGEGKLISIEYQPFCMYEVATEKAILKNKRYAQLLQLSGGQK